MVLFSTNMFEKIAKYFDISHVQSIARTSYYTIQKKFLAGVVHLNYCRINASLIRRLKIEGERNVSGDGRHDTPGHNAIICHILFDESVNK